jgi:hypothetical protein
MSKKTQTTEKLASTARAVALIDLPQLNKLAGQIVEGDQELVLQLVSAGAADSNEAAIAFAESASAPATTE